MPSTADVTGTENSYKLRKMSLFWEMNSRVTERVWSQPGVGMGGRMEGWERGKFLRHGMASWQMSPVLALALASGRAG